MCLPTGGGGAGDAQTARNDEQARQNNIRAGETDINNLFGSQFNDDFFNGRSKAYTDYAKPQLDDQYADAQKQLTYFLDRNGTLNSTARTQKDAELQKLYDTNNRAVNDQALNYANTARDSVATAKGNLFNELSSTGDKEGAVNAANSNAAALTTPDTYSPLGQLFSPFTNALATQAGLERASAYSGGAIKPAFNTGLFGVSNSAVSNS